MELIQAYLKRGIEGIQSGQLKNILNGMDSIKVNNITNGYIILNNQKILKCVTNYYKTNDDDNSKLKKNFSNNCFFAQKYLKLQGINNYDCANCHKRCLEMLQNNEIKRRRIK